MTFPTPNSDEGLVSQASRTPAHDKAPFVGNFHKTLPHDQYGEVQASAYRAFERACMQIEAGAPVNFEEVPAGPMLPSALVPQTAFEPGPAPTNEINELFVSAAKFTSPLAGASTETFGADPRTLEMPPAPSCRSLSASAEIAELYWMALLRDAPLAAFQATPTAPSGTDANLSAHNGALGFDVPARVDQARVVVNRLFDIAVSQDSDPGRLRTPLDVAAGGGGAQITKQTLFRSGLIDEEHGPLLSQFFLRPIGYGVQMIDPLQVPYVAKADFLTSHGDWLLAQNTGKDRFGRDYANCNSYADQVHRGAKYYPTGNPRRLISTMRDLARFVNRDALHQAYFNAALFLLGINAPLDAGNPYRGARFSREGAFATLGGPDLLTVVSEVASRALKVVWRQKWLVHRRCRPEVFAGLIQMQVNGFGGTRRQYGLRLEHPGTPDFKTRLDETLAAVSAHNAALNGAGGGTLFLPMAFSAGSPSHPAYGAGHATVAGACVTVLKAWFDEDAKLVDVFRDANEADLLGHVAPNDPPGGTLEVLQPGYRVHSGGIEDFSPPRVYASPDAARMTIGGELNKVASNVAMGRSMGGVHWRTDNTRSLRLGEQVAFEVLRKRSLEYAERPLCFNVRTFDGQRVQISRGEVRVL